MKRLRRARLVWAVSFCNQLDAAAGCAAAAAAAGVPESDQKLKTKLNPLPFACAKRKLWTPRAVVRLCVPKNWRQLNNKTDDSDKIEFCDDRDCQLQLLLHANQSVLL